MKQKTRVGDVFRMPIADGKVCYGQVVAACEPIFYMVAFDYLCNESDTVDIHTVVKSPILFLGNFFDALIKNGEWLVVGNTSPNLNCIPFPSYQVQIEGKTYVESWDGERHRLASAEEAELLDRPANFGPVWLEDALKAHYGYGLDDPEYRKFGLNYVAARAGSVV